MTTTNQNTTDRNTPRTETPGVWLRRIARQRRIRLREQYRAERRARREAIAATAREGISDEDYATTMATLETMARNLGWDESADDESDGERVLRGWRGHHGHRGHGHRRHERA